MNLKDMKIGQTIIFASFRYDGAGVILWISQRDGNGIIKDENGNELYFDKSSCKNFAKLKAKDDVTFIPKRIKPDNLLVAKNVEKA